MDLQERPSDVRPSLLLFPQRSADPQSVSKNGLDLGSEERSLHFTEVPHDLLWVLPSEAL